MSKIEYNKLKNNGYTDSKLGEISYSEIIEKKSKFISYIFSISSKEEAISCIESVKRKYYDAKHVVYIYSYLENNIPSIKFSDDGEPKGTGTKAIYELITKENLTNICIVIVRYFGGILLGAGPLSRTYLNSARESILRCDREVIYNYETINLKLSYNEYNKIKYILDVEKENENISDIVLQYNELINIDITVKEAQKDRIENLLLNNIK